MDRLNPPPEDNPFRDLRITDSISELHLPGLQEQEEPYSKADMSWIKKLLDYIQQPPPEDFEPEYQGEDSEFLMDWLPEPRVVSAARTDKFTFNTDGSSFGKYSKSHQGRTATGIGNGGEILGFTIPLDSSLKRIKKVNGKPVANKFQAALVTFFSQDKTETLLLVGNDTGGRHINGNRRKRGWGEFGVNTYKELQSRGFPITMKKNSLGVPRDMEATYEFLDTKVYNVRDYKNLKAKLTEQKRL